MNNKIRINLLTMFGVGYLRYAPGSIASFITCLIFYLLWSIFGIKNFFFPTCFFLLLLTFFSIFLINKIYPGKDPKEIVIDELIGQSIPLLAWNYVNLSSPVWQKTLGTFFENHEIEIWIILSFILFRFFDIFKPFPIGFIDKKIKNGFGVMLDDIIAGIFSTISLYFLFLWI
tara:strand:+ start:21 stop:539 length:519 start_codon:yes stop_codon:yes gene_type:complete